MIRRSGGLALMALGAAAVVIGTLNAFIGLVPAWVSTGLAIVVAISASVAFELLALLTSLGVRPTPSDLYPMPPDATPDIRRAARPPVRGAPLTSSPRRALRTKPRFKTSRSAHMVGDHEQEASRAQPSLAGDHCKHRLHKMTSDATRHSLTSLPALGYPSVILAHSGPLALCCGPFVVSSPRARLTHTKPPANPGEASG
jgi:hypothetical protein